MPPEVEVGEAWGFGMGKTKEGLIGIKGDHDVWKSWSDEFKSMFY